jgi:hypothetical protein
MSAMKDTYMKNTRGSSMWKNIDQPNLVYLGGNKLAKSKVDIRLPHSPFLNQANIKLDLLKPSDIDLNRDSFDFGDMERGASLGKASYMVPVRPGKSQRRGSLSSSQYFKK